MIYVMPWNIKMYIMYYNIMDPMKHNKQSEVSKRENAHENINYYNNVRPDNTQPDIVQQALHVVCW